MEAQIYWERHQGRARYRGRSQTFRRYVVCGTVGRSFCAFIKGNVLEATTCVVSGYCLLGQSEEPRVKELNWILEKKKCSEVQYIPVHFAFILESCGPLGH